MKFGKYLEENHVPEWRDKYVQYKQIRKKIKKFKAEIDQFKNDPEDQEEQSPHTPHSYAPNSLKRNSTYSNLVKRAAITGSSTGVHSPFDGNQSTGLQLDSVSSGELQMAFVNSLAASAGVNTKQRVLPLHSQNVLQRLIEIQGEMTEIIMDEAKKVNEFYVEREKEAIERFNQIYSQVHKLIQLRQEEETAIEESSTSEAKKESYSPRNKFEKLVNKKVKTENEKSKKKVKKPTTTSSSSLSLSNSIPTSPSMSGMSVDSNSPTQIVIGITPEKSNNDHHHQVNEHLIDSNNEEEEEEEEEYGEADHSGGEEEEEEDSHPETIIEMVPIGDDGANPMSSTLTRKNIILDVFETIEQDMIQPLENKAKKWFKLGKKKNNEHTMKELIQEFYRFLILVKNYKVLNYSALVKIIKKAEKNTELVLNDKIISTADKMMFKTSKLIDKLSGSIEKIYADVFCNGKLRDARKNLRHRQNAEQGTIESTTGTTFFSGMCAGWTTAILILIYFVLYTGEYDDFVRFGTVYNLFVTLGLAILWALMFGIDIYIWTKAHVHYSFIFELSRNTLTYHRVFQAVTVLSVLWITSIGIYMWKSMGNFPFPFVSAEYTPLILLVVYLLILICPFNIFQREVRKWFLLTIWRVVTAPAKTVKFSHFFMGDQLSSLVLMMVQLSQFICFYTVDVYHSPEHAVCIQKGRYINPFISALPATWRLLQCFRRYYDSKDIVHLRNALKYFLSIVVVFFSAIDSFYSTGWTSPTRIIWLSSGLINSCYSYWWDLFMDWSILVKPKTSSWNPFKYTLRKKRMYSPTFVYYIAIITNFGFRMTWSLTKSLPQLTTLLPSYKLVVVIAVIEVLRRGQWNVYRLENEHINNCGRFRATRDIPLPYELN
ncbi:SPX domain-containing protein [Heterostelium album PN500]|uniref:SPX domain-containing protein n=1 Tax=Heterostelium pallidum (strain ATCC 26659 / Pp 5 / PN500) TaxID=670386 RepID=D3B217_HETP5|nr:SPX domain-containing protein [Heterostelium album PN500]EFA85341.1 SPX domain-containing protein [Heterostelium album PN500]|eukprot:XP_020437450.1 SPX domain-containing protein [Heterostelium album PN500]